MPGIWTKLHFERELTDTASGDGIVEAWSVQGATPDIARTDPEAIRRGDPHPDAFPVLIANSVSYSPIPYGTYVRVNYVPPEYLDPEPPEDNTGDDWFRNDNDHQDEDVKIPVFEKVTKKLPGPDETTVEKTVWQGRENTVPFRKSLTTIRVTLNADIESGFSFNDIIRLTDAVTDQNNKIHTIFGRKMLFKSNGSTRVSKTKYRFNYLWIIDPGVLYTENFIVVRAEGTPTTGPGFAIIGSEAFPVANIQYVIPPFSRVRTSPSSDDPEALPVVSVSLAYQEDPDGWQFLPGIGA